MKKLFISAGFFLLITASCNDNKKEKEVAATIATTDSPSKPAPDSATTAKATKPAMACVSRGMGGYKGYSLDQTAQMIDNYDDLLWNDYSNLILQINMDPHLLSTVVCNIDNIKFLSAAENKNVTVMVEYVQGGAAPAYYDIKDIFGKNTLCPPPNNCGIPFTDKEKVKRPKLADSLQAGCGYPMSKFHAIDEGKILEMQKKYLSTVSHDTHQAIEQIILAPALLHDILCDADVFKLIGAVDEKNDITMIVEYGIGGKLTYYNLKEIFGNDCLCLFSGKCILPVAATTKHAKHKKK